MTRTSDGLFTTEDAELNGEITENGFEVLVGGRRIHLSSVSSPFSSVLSVVVR
jgi:hypothetical protein